MLFVELALPPAVVQFDDFERLDEERLAARRRVMNNARHVAPRASARTGRTYLPSRVVMMASCSDAAKRPPVTMELSRSIKRLCATRTSRRIPRQLSAGRVQDVATRANGTADIGLQFGQLDQMGRELS